MFMVATNLSHTGQQTNGSRGTLSGNHGRGNRFARSRCHGRGRPNTGSILTCHLYGKHGHDVIECWHRFDESFMPHITFNLNSNVACSSSSKQD